MNIINIQIARRQSNINITLERSKWILVPWLKMHDNKFYSNFSVWFVGCIDANGNFSKREGKDNELFDTWEMEEQALDLCGDFLG